MNEKVNQTAVQQGNLPTCQPEGSERERGGGAGLHALNRWGKAFAALGLGCAALFAQGCTHCWMCGKTAGPRTAEVRREQTAAERASAQAAENVEASQRVLEASRRGLPRYR